MIFPSSAASLVAGSCGSEWSLNSIRFVRGVVIDVTSKKRYRNDTGIQILEKRSWFFRRCSRVPPQRFKGLFLGNIVGNAKQDSGGVGVRDPFQIEKPDTVVDITS